MPQKGSRKRKVSEKKTKKGVEKKVVREYCSHLAVKTTAWIRLNKTGLPPDDTQCYLKELCQVNLSISARVDLIQNDLELILRHTVTTFLSNQRAKEKEIKITCKNSPRSTSAFLFTSTSNSISCSCSSLMFSPILWKATGQGCWLVDQGSWPLWIVNQLKQ